MGGGPEDASALMACAPALLGRPADALTAEELEQAFSRSNTLLRPSGPLTGTVATNAVPVLGPDMAAVRGTARVTTITAATSQEVLDKVLAAVSTASRLAIVPALSKTGSCGTIVLDLLQ